MSLNTEIGTSEYLCNKEIFRILVLLIRSAKFARIPFLIAESLIFKLLLEAFFNNVLGLTLNSMFKFLVVN